MSDSRDTLILPCRHLCLCNACADSLRYQANNCPICRAPFRALLQIRAVRKSAAPLNTSGTQNLPVSQQQNLSGSTADLVELPPGYEPYPLLEALNGPSNHQPLSGHGMYSFRPEVPAVEGTPNAARRTRRDKREHRRNSSSTSLHSRARMPIPVSPSTPEVVVSGTPLSPNKDGLPPSREMDKWPVPAKRSTVAAVNTELETLTDQESTSSTSSTNGAAAESTRLLVDEDDPPPPVPRPRGEKNIDIEAVRSHGTSSGSRTASHNGLPDTRV
ncbi:putative E3 ubiquitin ligase [Halotydeus destructor]|nr:putative E3 ubiquitin ligase [Halotydeus destructor]